MSKNIIPIVFCFDKRIILGASVSIKSLIDTAKPDTIYDIRIFHSDLDIKNQKNISELARKTNHNIAFHYIDPEIFKDTPHNKKSWTELVYYRLLSPEIIKEYDKIIYSDVDVLFKNDLADIFNLDMLDYELAAVRAEINTPNVIGHNYFEENKKDFIFWSGFLMFNCKKYRENKTFDKLLKNAKKYYSRLKFFDLDLVNITCDNIMELPLNYCVLQSLYYKNYKEAREYEYLKKVYCDNDIESAAKNPVIVHYAGKPGKPWRMKKPYEDYQKYIDSLPHVLKKYTFRDIRKKLFSKV